MADIPSSPTQIFIEVEIQGEIKLISFINPGDGCFFIVEIDDCCMICVCYAIMYDELSSCCCI